MKAEREASMGMTARVREHLRSQMVGYIALFAFAIGGTAQAVDGPLDGINQVGSEDIINDDVGSADLANGHLLNVDIADETIESGKVEDGTLTDADFFSNSVAGPDIDEATLFGDNSLTSDDIDESTLFNDDSLTSSDLFFFAAGPAEIATGAVGTSEVADSSLDAGDLAPSSAGASEIPSNAVRSSELGPVVVERKAATIASNSFVTVTVECPAGYAPLNVGFAGALGLRVRGTSAVSNGEVSGFNVLFDNKNSDESKAAEVAAVCLRA